MIMPKKVNTTPILHALNQGVDLNVLWLKRIMKALE
jgi:hypothetical protein